ncbi:MAG: ATPase [Bacteroidetes bacterium GWC2_33_15]|nr:MAG: ATPase [Bacteroidetes bacterium GWA2_33_15]OFX50172.1 MAG: ATPase [Bacteroidetes bacterium GWC2_33_15]OFX65324.1 MAG: ATPase [Bacteroidetes bacterium GWB2_32_14]OFX70551.1 MAG: ATPase [Bacteroidetes bacterium GWD2_33_33]HAN19575.1 ATPase [Bacteroidales bacterium]
MEPFLKSENYTGLTEGQVYQKLISEGYNELPSSKPRGILQIGLGVIKEPMFLLLVACGTLYLILGDIQEGLMLLGFVFVIMGIEFYQEKKTEKALDALKDLASPRALVIRDGITKRIAGKEVVTDDIVILQEGDRVPADAIVLNCNNLLADESLLTGESVPVRKREWKEGDKTFIPGGDDIPVVYSGSMIVQGNGIVKVIATATNTEIGKIGKALESVKEEPTRLKREMGVLVRRLAIIGITLCILVIGIYTLTRGDLLKGFLAGITLAMAMLPEEFPVVLTVFLALGAWRISKKNVLTRNPAAIETLGSATVLCTDKTGTLTQNKMTVTRLYNGAIFHKIISGNILPEPFHQVIEYGILSSQANAYDPMERAIINIGNQFLQDTEHIHTDWVMEKEYPLSKELLAMSRVFSNTGTNERVIAAKGAPEAIFDLCHLNNNTIANFEKAVAEMASSGLRVLGVARAKLIPEELPSIQHDFDFEFIGLIGLSDPIRENVPAAVKECYKAGIRVIMITGDYPVTATNIGKDIGIKNYELCITGPELQDMTEEVLCERIKTANIFARVVPEQKLKIVNALKRNNEIVAMTGDGVNDAPALKASNIGIAMGEKGTDVAREASSLVLMDDNFASIVGAVKMGRKIFDNLQKALAYIFAIHVPIAGLSLIPVFFADLPLILWPIHIVFLELIIDPACSIIFEAEIEEKNVMSRPPKNIEEPFFGAKKIILSCIQGVGILIISLLVYFISIKMGYSEKSVRTLTFVTLIISNIAVILSNRSWSTNIFKIIVTPNKAVKWVIGGAVIFLILILNIPFLLDLFLFEKIGIPEILICTFAGFFSILWFEFYKKMRQAKKAII